MYNFTYLELIFLSLLFKKKKKFNGLSVICCIYKFILFLLCKYTSRIPLTELDWSVNKIISINLTNAYKNKLKCILLWLEHLK